MQKRVAILGGGVAGMSAAHELVERGFDVEVFEARDVPGGKARSIFVAGTGTGGREDLPGEHGFRFFPGFYKHLPDTMRRIPFGGNLDGVFGNLVQTTRVQLSRAGGGDAVVPARFPANLADFYQTLVGLFEVEQLGVPDDELLYFFDRVMTILTSCRERRLAEYEGIAWWDFVGAATRSPEYQAYLARGLTRSLVAMRAEIASTRTVGDILVQLLLDTVNPLAQLDRVLDGPTQDVWLNPWLDYLRQRGVVYHTGALVTALHCVEDRLTGFTARLGGGPGTEYAADYYVSALPVEQLLPLLTPEIKAAAPTLADLDQLETAWMNGIQFFLKTDFPIVNGHVIYASSPWALTSISQAQFWKQPMDRYGDGTVRGVLSVDISNWEEPGILYGTAAKDLNDVARIKEEVVAQIRASLDGTLGQALDDANIVAWALDRDIVMPNPTTTTNLEPLLINTAGSWQHRPEAATGIPNFFVAADFVRTHTDLATMEGANEAARRAVNGILDAAQSLEPRCALWPLEEPAAFAPLRDYDLLRFKLGLPHGHL